MPMSRRLRIALVALTVAAGLAVAADVSVVVRGPLVLAAVLIAPGLAVSFSMGPMTIEMRALISVVTSAALVTLLAVVMMWADRWSGGVAFAVAAAVTIGCTLYPARATPGDHT